MILLSLDEYINGIIDQGRSYVNVNINISHCIFSRSKVYSLDNGYGGVIYINGGTYSMILNYSMFHNCFSSERGGAIYPSSTNSDLRMICANNCSCGSSCVGNFAYIIASHVNQVEYLSISNCSITTSRYNPIILFSGNQSVYNINMSMNNDYLGSGICTYSPSTFTSSYCTYSNNKASYGICLYLYNLRNNYDVIF